MERTVWKFACSLFVMVVGLVAVGCFGEGPSGMCWVDDLPKHECDTRALTRDQSVGSGQVSGEMLVEWYGEDAIGPGVHIFYVEHEGARDEWVFEVVSG